MAHLKKGKVFIMKKIVCLILAAAMLLIFSACSGAGNMGGPWMVPEGGEMNGNYDYLGTKEENADYEMAPSEFPGVTPDVDNNSPLVNDNPFITTDKEPTSTISTDVDTVSYSLFRKYVNMGCDLSALRDYGRTYYYHTEEMVNYFRYDYQGPKTEGELFGVQSALSPCPWNADSLLLTMGFCAENKVESKGNNLVFLIDVSGSMSSDDKLKLIRESFTYLIDNLTENDVVSIVTYAGQAGTLLDGARGNEQQKIRDAVAKLTPGGSTAGQAGLSLAYEVAERHYIEGGNNRIILASDGDFNVGISTSESMTDFIKRKCEQGTYISVMAVGNAYSMNLSMMEAIANNGNGVYYFLDGKSEAERIFGEALTSTLYTVGDDVKMQITFAPELVESYRLVGYENRVMANEDFEDDTKDAAEVGAGHMLTVVYEIKPTESIGLEQSTAPEFAKLSVRFKRPGATESTLNEYPLSAASDKIKDEDVAFITAVVRLSMLLNNSTYSRQDSLARIYETMAGMTLTDTYKLELRSLIAKLLK